MKIFEGDNLEIMKGMEEGTYSAILTDAPYGLQFMGKKWDYEIPSVEQFAEMMRVTKAGGYIFCFAGSRTFHRMAVNIEDAGWIIKDCIMWLHGMGFPKSHAIDKGIDKMRHSSDQKLKVTRWIGQMVKKSGKKPSEIIKAVNGSGCPTLVCKWTAKTKAGQPKVPDIDQIERLIEFLEVEEIPEHIKHLIFELNSKKYEPSDNFKKRTVTGQGLKRAEESIFGMAKDYTITDPYTEQAQKWAGYGTALKPAFEPIIVAMKPLEGTYAENAMNHGVAGLNIEAARIKTGDTLARPINAAKNAIFGRFQQFGNETEPSGRWPANVILTHADNCKYKGVKKVKGHTGYPNGAGGSRFKFDNTPNREDPIKGHADPDGLETVEEWACAEGCPVKELDDQSGHQKSGVAGQKSRAWGAGGEVVISSKENGVGWKANGSEGYADQGGASRFFKQVRATEAEKEAASNWECVKGCPVKELDEQSGISKSAGGDGYKNSMFCGGQKTGGHGLGDVGGASRFFYCAKPTKKEKGKFNKHPTVKPLKLMKYLLKMLKMPEGTKILDPFAGSGTTLLAAKHLKIECDGIEMSQEYVQIIKNRLKIAEDKEFFQAEKPVKKSQVMKDDDPFWQG